MKTQNNHLKHIHFWHFNFGRIIECNTEKKIHKNYFLVTKGLYTIVLSRTTPGPRVHAQSGTERKETWRIHRGKEIENQNDIAITRARVACWFNTDPLCVRASPASWLNKLCTRYENRVGVLNGTRSRIDRIDS